MDYAVGDFVGTDSGMSGVVTKVDEGYSNCYVLLAAPYGSNWPKRFPFSRLRKLSLLEQIALTAQNDE